MPNISRTIWTKDEYRRVAAETARIESGHKTLTGAMDAAQRTVLPANRWRKKPKGPTGLVAFMPYLDVARKAKAELDKPNTFFEEPPKAIPTLPGEWGVKEVSLKDYTGIGEAFSKAPPPVEPDKQDLMGAPSSIDAALVPIKEILSDYIAEVLVESVRKLLTNGEIARVLRSMSQGAVPEVIREQVPRHNPAPFSQAPKAAKKTVLVCGLLPHQQNELQQSAADLGLHLKFWYAEKSNEGIGALKDKALGADVVVFRMVNTDHSAVNTVTAMGKRVLRVTGGTSTMLEALKGVAV